MRRILPAIVLILATAASADAQQANRAGRIRANTITAHDGCASGWCQRIQPPGNITMSLTVTQYVSVMTDPLAGPGTWTVGGEAHPGGRPGDDIECRIDEFPLAAGGYTGTATNHDVPSSGQMGLAIAPIAVTVAAGATRTYALDCFSHGGSNPTDYIGGEDTFITWERKA